MKFKFLFFLVFLGLGVQPPLSWAQSDIRTTSNNLRNQFHRNLLGQCSATSIDCGPHTAGGTNITTGQTRVTNGVPLGPITCVAAAFGTAAGDLAGGTPGNSDNCLTTAGIQWPGGVDTPRCGDNAGIIPECGSRFSADFSFSGLPRIPTGADTQFGTGVGIGTTGSNVQDIGGTANNSPVPAGSSNGIIRYTIRQEMLDMNNNGCEGVSGAAEGCFSAFRFRTQAPRPGTATTCIDLTCPADFVGFRIQSSVASLSEQTANCGGAFCRKNEIEYGIELRFANGIVEQGGACAEGSTATGGCSRGVGRDTQHFEISYRVVSFTDANGNLIGNPTGSYRSRIGNLGADVFNVTGAGVGTTLTQEIGTFSTRVCYTRPNDGLGTCSDGSAPPATLPDIILTFTEDDATAGCQHDSAGTNCSVREATGQTFMP